MAGRFNTLDKIYDLTTPSDLGGTLKRTFGTTEGNANLVKELLDLFVGSNAAGVKKFEDIKQTLTERFKKSQGSTDNKQLSDAITEMFSLIDKTGTSLDETYWKDASTKDKKEANVLSILGKSATSLDLSQQNVGISLIRSPFVHPATRNTNECDLFLNFIPSIFASRMVPYLSVEFQTIDVGGNSGLVKFLMGSERPMSPGDIAINAGNSIRAPRTADSNVPSYTTFGMEAFTSPQTLTNVNGLNATNGNRYVDVLDPFKPLASIEQLNISVVPAGAGTYTYKKATLTLKLHDRSRITEISELITPKRYKDVTVWLTYGWLAPEGDDEYSKFINQKMLQREAYGIVNSSFTFDVVGQMTINIELFTKGAAQLQTTTIIDNELDEVNRLRELAEEISRLRKATLNEPPEGMGKDIRIYQLLDSAQAGSYPDMNVGQVQEAIASLEKTLSRTDGGDKHNERELLKKLKDYYGKDKEGKFLHKEVLAKQVTSKVQERFKELLSGYDPFLPVNKDKKFVDPELSALCQKYNTEPQSKNTPKFAFKKAVSFGKLFSTFVIPSLLAKQAVDEVQVNFYAMNEQCGPISLHSIAEFPVDLVSFMDQYSDHVAARGGEKFTVAEFLQLVLNSQFMDNRAIGYGLRQFYEPYDSKNPEAKTKSGNTEKEFEAALAAMVSKYGGFKKPAIDMYVETLHLGVSKGAERPSRASLFDQLGDSIQLTTSRDALSIEERKARGQTTIMRIHIYDKQLTPYTDADSIVKVDADGGTLFATVNKGKIKSEIVNRRMQGIFANQTTESFIKQKSSSATYGYELVNKDGVGSNSLVRNYLGNTLPKITFGTNGTTVLAASLASKQDPLLSTVNMLKNDRVKNTVSPNGAGDFGLPLRVVPATLSLTTLGCPLASMAQQYFIDFQTGTTLDNLYIVTGLAHVISPGKFETSWTMGYSDAYGRFVGAQNISDVITDLSKKLEQDEKQAAAKPPQKSKSSGGKRA